VGTILHDSFVGLIRLNLLCKTTQMKMC